MSERGGDRRSVAHERFYLLPVVVLPRFFAAAGGEQPVSAEEAITTNNKPITQKRADMITLAKN